MMKYVIKNTSGLMIKHLPILGHGNQGTVFKNGKYATKVFNLGNTRPNDLDGSVATKISYLDLNAFVKPFNLKFKNNSFYSFDMELLHLERKNIVDIDIEDVISSLRLIREDVSKISDAGIQINDLQTHNIGVSKDRIRVFDFSDYSFSDNKNLRKINDSEIDSLFGSFCIMAELDDIDPIKIYDYIYVDYFRSGCDTIEDYFSLEILGKYKNIREFVNSKIDDKKMIKKNIRIL